MSTVTTVTEAKAKATLAAIRDQYAGVMTERVIDGETYPAAYPEPTLIMDYTDSGHPAIVWEEGPSEWPFLVGGGTSEEDHVMYASLSEEFGVEMKPPVRPAAKVPAGVFVEPVNHIVLGVYPA